MAQNRQPSNPHLCSLKCDEKYVFPRSCCKTLTLYIWTWVGGINVSVRVSFSPIPCPKPGEKNPQVVKSQRLAWKRNVEGKNWLFGFMFIVTIRHFRWLLPTTSLWNGWLSTPLHSGQYNHIYVNRKLLMRPKFSDLRSHIPLWYTWLRPFWV